MKVRHAIQYHIQLILYAVLFLIGITVHAHAASFDCSQASTRIERLVCGDPELSYQDERLSLAYVRMRAMDLPGHVEEQRHWLTEVRDACQDTECLRQAYVECTREVLRQAMHSPQAADAGLREDDPEKAASSMRGDRHLGA